MKHVFAVLALIMAILVGGYFLLGLLPEEMGAPLFVLFVIVEVILAPIPGGVLGYLGAERFGFWLAWPLLYIGNLLGGAIVFSLAQRLGRPYVERHVKEKSRSRYDAVLRNHPRLLWFVYAIPVFPIDIVSIMAGFSGMRLQRFLLIIATALPIYTGLVALLASLLAEHVRVVNLISALAMVALVALGVYLWRTEEAKHLRGRIRERVR